jgi:hypothetical protein
LPHAKIWCFALMNSPKRQISANIGPLQLVRLVK